MLYDNILLNQYLPPAIGVIILIVGAGMLGLFRATRIQSVTFNNSVESLERQLEIVKEENELLRTQNDQLRKQVQDLTNELIG